ncbi:hypothetical protein HJ590_12555 [Naumannella sp. ID2617S]|nr:hypothetical protein [Naumannella sp. ID2617S]
MTNTEQNDVTVTETAGTNDTAADKPQEPTWRDALPWEGKPSRGDKVLLGSMFAITGFYLAMLPVKPFLIANHPILLEFVTGSKAAVGAGAAFARIGQAPLWLVIVAGVIGAAKFDWLFWLMGRRWGGRVVRMFAPNDRARARIDKAEQLPRWVGPLAVCLAVLPGGHGVRLRRLAEAAARLVHCAQRAEHRRDRRAGRRTRLFGWSGGRRPGAAGRQVCPVGVLGADRRRRVLEFLEAGPQAEGQRSRSI